MNWQSEKLEEANKGKRRRPKTPVTPESRIRFFEEDEELDIVS